MTDIPKSQDQWKDKLTTEQLTVCQHKATEKPFTGKYYQCTTEGIYQCVCCENDLFGSESKYDSGSGWPSFWDVFDSKNVTEVVDTSHGMRRVEIICTACDSHLGHVFEDGPQPTGLRYCVNSASLVLKETE